MENDPSLKLVSIHKRIVCSRSRRAKIFRNPDSGQVSESVKFFTEDSGSADGQGILNGSLTGVYMILYSSFTGLVEVVIFKEYRERAW